ncbi:hypothetical protein AB3S75_016198 [Citrus x aurantiifolia]
MRQLYALSPPQLQPSLSSNAVVSSSPSIPKRRRHLYKMPLKKKPLKLKRLTSRIFEEIEIVNREHWKLNTIVMNASDDCSVDSVTYGTVLKVRLGELMKHIKYLSQWKKATAVGSPKLSARLICGLVNALIEADLCRSNGLLAQYGFLLHEGGNPSVLFYNLLMKGHISAGCPEVVINLHDEMSHVGLEPDSLSYNTLISACIKTKKLDVTMPFNEQLKDNEQKCSSGGFHPDIFTYATLLMGFRHAKDLQSLLEIVFEMKSCCNLILDRTTFTAMVDALLNSGSIKVVGLYALCIFGEIVKRACSNPDECGQILPELYPRKFKKKLGLLLMEAALNDGQVDLALDKLSNTITRWKGI